jgi:hypothetical protein
MVDLLGERERGKAKESSIKPAKNLAIARQA